MALDLAEALLQTQALRIAPTGQVFWYTSGTVGPYYINTHYLFGGPEAAAVLLAFIDAEKGDTVRFPGALQARLEGHAAGDPVYAGVVDALARLVSTRTGAGYDAVSGGERRDWFFSPLVAARLGKPHLWIAKDRTATWSHGAGTETAAGVAGPASGLAGQRLVHVADLITEASSYLRSWIPAIEQQGGRMVGAANVVDRAQGGAQALAGAGVPAVALLRVDEELFASLERAGHIDAAQKEGLLAYRRDPHAAMKSFLQEHPEFLRQALASPEERTAGRARTLVEQNPYGLELDRLLD